MELFISLGNITNPYTVKIERLYHTLKPLKWKQFYYRFYYGINRKLKQKETYLNFNCGRYRFKNLNFSLLLIDEVRYNEGSFTFIGLSHKFNGNINWNFLDHGKLWAYNLNYFEFINDENIGLKLRLQWIENFIDSIDDNHIGLEAYPSSLRIINWIKFISYNNIDDSSINKSLAFQILNLSKNLEYHLLGNHLLENGFGLLFGAFFLNDNTLLKKAENIIRDELNEQILNDGGHFELSPMYHQIILYRVLESINLISNNNNQSSSIRPFLEEIAPKCSIGLTMYHLKWGYSTG